MNYRSSPSHVVLSLTVESTCSIKTGTVTVASLASVYILYPTSSAWICMYDNSHCDPKRPERLHWIFPSNMFSLYMYIQTSAPATGDPDSESSDETFDPENEATCQLLR